MGFLLAVIGLLIGYYGRFWSFFYDEWGTILYRRTGGPSSFLAAHNGHLQATVIGVYRLLFATVGLRSYGPYLAVIVVTHLALMALLYGYAKQRVGPWLAIVLTLPLAMLAHAWQVLFWAINLGFVLPLIALVVLVRWRRPAVLGIAVMLALLSSGLGVAVAAGALVLAVTSPARVRFLVAWSVPVTAYGIWWVGYRSAGLPPANLRRIGGAAATGDVGSLSIPGGNLGRTPNYVLHSAKAASAAFLGLGRAGGWWPLLAVVLLVVAAVVVRRCVSPALLCFVVVLLVFWVETGLARAQFGSPESAGTSRYLYPGTILLILMLTEAFDGVRLRPTGLLVLSLGVGLVLAQDVHTLRVYSRATQSTFAQEATNLKRACDPRLPADFALDPLRAPGLTAGPYRAAVRALGSPSGQACADRRAATRRAATQR